MRVGSDVVDGVQGQTFSGAACDSMGGGGRMRPIVSCTVNVKPNRQHYRKSVGATSTRGFRDLILS